MYHVTLKVFSCTCFVHNVSSGLDKLSAKAIKCVFLGYSLLQKGYKCYSLQTKKCYMSTNVTFFEETPFFSSSMQNPGSIQQILPVPSFGPMILPTQDLSNQEGHQP